MTIISIKQSLNNNEAKSLLTLKSNHHANKAPIYDIKQLQLWYGQTKALKEINMTIYEREVTAIIGPSGCGKSTFLKTLNRIVELVPSVRVEGQVIFQNENIFSKAISPSELRTKVGMVFQKANPFPKTIYDNVAYGPRIHGIRHKKVLDEIVEMSLKKAFLWEEVKDRLRGHAYSLSGGQQQRLCLARCLAIEPEVILMDEPTSALDPQSTYQIEQLIEQLKHDYTIIIVTHNMQQAARISDRTAFFLNGEIVEYDLTKTIFNHPSDNRTADYIHGKFG